MAKYFYTARSQTGEQYSGTMEAKSEQDLAKTLREQGLLLVKATLEPEEKCAEPGAFLKKLRLLPLSLGGVRVRDKMFFARNLGVMVASGISLPRALKIVAEQTKNRKFKAALKDSAEQIIKGESFSEALGRHPGCFSELFRNMIKVGEESGTLENVLRVLAEQIEKEHGLKSKIASALVYPSVIIAAMLAIGVVMLIVVVPKLAETFQELGVELPPTTQLVIYLGTLLAGNWYWALLILIIFLILARAFLKSGPGTRAFSSIVLKVPIISAVVKKANSASALRTLSSLIAAGVPIVRSLEITSNALVNFYFKKAFQETAGKVKKGQKIAEALKSHQKLFPALVLDMVAIGEETGETSSILAKLADFYEEEVASATKNLSAVIEPFLMLLIGATVGFFAVSMIQPMYAMLGAL